MTEPRRLNSCNQTPDIQPRGNHYNELHLFTFIIGALGSVVGSDTMLTCRKVAGSIPDEVTGFVNYSNPSSRTIALGSTQPLTEMSTRNLSGN
jgi:hypothetical protein